MILTSAEIKEILPHRYPMLLIDRITSLEPLVRATGIKNVSHNDPFFEGHFPDRPIMPGVLVLEAMAQVGGVALMYPEEHRGKLAVFGGMDKVKFRRQVVPGDQLVMHAEILRIKGTMGKILCRSFVDDQLAAEGEFMFALV